MKNFTLLFSISLLAGCWCLAQPNIKLTSIASGFSRPVDIANAGDARLFIVEQQGVIRIIGADGTVLPNPFLNIVDKVGSSGNEQGLLGLVFHPNYATNGYFYVNYTNKSGDSRISRFLVNSSNPNAADPSSEKVLMSIDQPFSNHNAGDLAFGPDGFLYIGWGDGGSGGDPGNRSQTATNLLGKMLRIDVDKGDPYNIPGDNPFVGSSSIRNEIWAIGLRNPWRYSFDRKTKDLWIADVGQNKWEYIHFQPAASKGGENYGWRCYEGFEPYNLNGCPPENTFTKPVHAYAHAQGDCSVTGGFVYRGKKYPALEGIYIYADFCSGRIWSLTANGSGGYTNRELDRRSGWGISTFGEDKDGELYLANMNSGVIYAISADPSTSVNKVKPLGELLVDPNPFKETLQVSVKLDVPSRVDLELLDIRGRKVWRQTENIQGTWTKSLNFSTLADGVYLLQVIGKNGKLTQRIVKN